MAISLVISPSASPFILGRHSTQWRRPWRNTSSWTFSRDPPQMSCREVSLEYQSIRRGWWFQTQLCPPGITRWTHVSSRDTWLQLSTVRQSSKQGVAPYYFRRSGRGIWRRHVQDTETALKKAIAASLALDAHWLRQETKTGIWLTVLMTTVNSMVMGY